MAPACGLRRPIARPKRQRPPEERGSAARFAASRKLERAQHQQELYALQQALEEERLATRELRQALDQDEAGLEEGLKALQRALVQGMAGQQKALREALEEARDRLRGEALLHLALQRALQEERAQHLEEKERLCQALRRAVEEGRSAREEEGKAYAALQAAQAEERVKHAAQVANLQFKVFTLEKEAEKWEQARQSYAAKIAACEEEIRSLRQSCADERSRSVAAERARLEEVKALQRDRDEAGAKQQEELRRRDEQLKKAHRAELSIQEHWRQQQSRDVEHVDDPLLLVVVQRMLKFSSHPVSTTSRCNAIHTAQVKRVSRVSNLRLWGRYTQCLQDMREEHARYQVVPGALQPPAGLEGPFPWLRLSPALNETLLWHGCSPRTAQLITDQGFDPRTSNPNGLYGEGTYFASQACKSMQYSQIDSDDPWRCMLLCRVALGDPEYVTQPRRGWKRPSARGSQGAFDSFVVNAGANGGQQAHREFVIFKGEQAYPELLIWFTI